MELRNKIGIDTFAHMIFNTYVFNHGCKCSIFHAILLQYIYKQYWFNLGFLISCSKHQLHYNSSWASAWANSSNTSIPEKKVWFMAYLKNSGIQNIEEICDRFNFFSKFWWRIFLFAFSKIFSSSNQYFVKNFHPNICKTSNMLLIQYEKWCSA